MADKSRVTAKVFRRGKHARRKAPVVLALVFVLAGLALVAYPYVSDYLNKVEQAKVTQTQQNVVMKTPKEDLSAYIKAAREYNRRLLEGRVRVTDPFDPNAKTVSNKEYESMLNLAGDGVMGQITIPCIGVDLPIYHGVTGEGMDHGVGHMPETSLPVGGKSTHAVLAGHTGLPSARIFDRLDELKKGDWFIIQTLGQTLAYRVTSTEVVLPDQTQSLAIEDGKDLVTLVTCTPYGVNTHRLLVHAERCKVPEAWKKMQEGNRGRGLGSGSVDVPMVELTLLGIGIGALVFAAVVLVLRARKRRGAAVVAGGAKGAGLGVKDERHREWHRGQHRGVGRGMAQLLGAEDSRRTSGQKDATIDAGNKNGPHKGGKHFR